MLLHRKLDRAAAHALLRGIESWDRLALAVRLCRAQQARARRDDALVGEAQVLAGTVLDRPHRLLQRRVLHGDALDAAVRAAALLQSAVDEVVVAPVRERDEGAGDVFHVDSGALL